MESTSKIGYTLLITSYLVYAVTCEYYTLVKAVGESYMGRNLKT